MKTDQTPDAKLLIARDRIRAIFEELDIAGYVVMHNQPNSFEVIVRLNPSYSIISGELPTIIVRSKLSEYGGDRDAQRRDLEASANLVRGFSEIIGINALQLDGLADAIDAKTGAIHTPMRPVGPRNAH
jgi:hypothetical protein